MRCRRKPAKPLEVWLREHASPELLEVRRRTSPAALIDADLASISRIVAKRGLALIGGNKRMRRSLFASAAALALATTAFAQQAASPPPAEPRPLSAFPELSPPDLPPVVVTIETPAAGVAAVSAPSAPQVEIAPPELPAATIIVETLSAPPAPAVDIPPPNLPEIRAVVEAPKIDAPETEIPKTQNPTATADAPTSAPSTVLADAAQALKARLEKDGPPPHPRLTRALREEIVAFYAARNHEYLPDYVQTETPDQLAARWVAEHRKRLVAMGGDDHMVETLRHAVACPDRHAQRVADDRLHR